MIEDRHKATSMHHHVEGRWKEGLGRAGVQKPDDAFVVIYPDKERTLLIAWKNPP